MRRRTLLPSLASAEQEALPTRPPTLVIPSPAGGIVDTAGRMQPPAGVRLGRGLRAHFDEYGMEARLQPGPELAELLNVQTRPRGGEAGFRAE